MLNHIADKDDDIGFAGTPSPSLITPIYTIYAVSNSDINSSNINMDFNNTNESLFLNSNTQIIPPKPSLNIAPPFITAAPAFNGVGTPSAPLAIINPHGSAITVWALAPVGLMIVSGVDLDPRDGARDRDSKVALELGELDRVIWGG